MYIAGMGIVFNRGRGLKCLEDALTQGWAKPSESAYRVPKEALTDKDALKEARRADNFTKMATLAAYDALTDSGIPPASKNRIGIILATALGPHATTFSFLDDILTYGDGAVSPTLFSHSVHNAAASYIALNLQTRGPTLTMTQFSDSFQQAIILAESWLSEKRCDFVLVGSVDQVGKVMEYICSQKLNLAADGKIKPFHCAKNPQAVPGEGSAFFLLANDPKYKKYCSISGLPDVSQNADLYILDSDGTCGSEEPYGRLNRQTPLAAYAPIFGSMLTLSSFSALVGALTIKHQKLYPNPVTDNPHQLNILTADHIFSVHKIACLRYNCNQEELIIRLF
jgi:3-oxoacyl-[acyl-carrier-protein] synthase II